jgi:predicted nucleotidyltransferase
MNSASERAATLLQAAAEWAQVRPDIAGLALVGSYAREAATPDSDVDLVVITSDPARYLDDLSWTTGFGEVLRRQLEDYGKVTSVRVWYADGLEVEYGITSEDWATLPLDEGTRAVIADGMKVLFERGDILSKL